MDYYYDVAFALANRSLCLFTGAGFSKQLTGNKMPGWKELLEQVCSYLNEPGAALSMLKECIDKQLPLEDCAHVLELCFLKEKKDFREAISDKIKSYSLDVDSAKETVDFLQKHQDITVISTNYDDLIQRYILPDRCNSNYPGRPITQRSGLLNIYHIHGSVEHPPGIIATTQDYYRFINSPSYFSRTIFTLMAEFTVVFLGYSVGDPNLKAILNAFAETKTGTLSRGGLFHVTRSRVPQYLRDHLEASYGLCVIEKTEIDAFYGGLEAALPDAESQVEKAEENLRKVLAGTHSYNDRYLKSSNALIHIISVANEIGENIESPPFIRLLADLLKRKITFTGESGAWEQYAHLAEWLVYIASLFRARGTDLEATYLEAVKHSMQRMSGSYQLGYSWEAYSIWKTNWGGIMFDNRRLISDFVQEQLASYADAMKVICEG